MRVPAHAITKATGLIFAASCLAAAPAKAEENGVSVYLLGSGGPGAAVLPPLEGIYYDNSIYIYDGDARAEREFPLNGRIVAGLDSTVFMDLATVLWVPSTNVAGGTLAIGTTVPIAAPSVNVSAVLTGPGGQQLSRSAQDSASVIGDPIFLGSLGWTWDKFHLTASALVNIPIGEYREDQLANVAFNRWAGDVSLAATWRDEESGWDFSTKAGVTFNGTNKYTDYDSGNSFHVEAAIEKIFSPAFSAGIVGYHYDQLSGDKGDGARLGPFKGKVTALGGTAAFNFVSGKTPVSVRFRVLQEFDARNRMEGTAALISFAFPLSMKMPPAGGQ